MIPLRTIPPLNKLDTISNNAGIVLHLDAELNHMTIEHKKLIILNFNSVPILGIRNIIPKQ